MVARTMFVKVLDTENDLLNGSLKKKLMIWKSNDVISKNSLEPISGVTLKEFNTTLNTYSFPKCSEIKRS